MSSHEPTTELASIHIPQPTQILQACVDQWARKQNLEKTYKLHKRRSGKRVNLVARQAVSHIALTRFTNVQRNHSHGTDATLPEETGSEDLSFSLRNFVTVNLIDDPNVLFARIAVKEGRVLAGYIPPLPQLRIAEESEEANVGLEGETCEE